MFPEAHITVTLSIADGAVSAAAIHSTRMVHASKLFAGRRPEEVIRLLPTVFSLCGTAQRIAAEMAFEDALGIAPPPSLARSRQTALLAETIGEHGLGMARDWPALLGEPPDLHAAKALRGRDIEAAHAVFATLLGSEPDVLDDEPSFRAWAERGATSAARLLAKALALSGAGTYPFSPLPAGGPPGLADRLSADTDGAYVAFPEGGYETGPLARQAAHPLIAALLRAHGAGIVTRLAARLVELSRALREPVSLMQNSIDAPALTAGSGSGLGLVEAARGLLAHRVELEDGLVKRYQILAPTEWNFHPAGPLARGLVGAPAEGIEHRARLLVHALDPCVACGVSVTHA